MRNISDISSKIREIYSIEELSANKSIIHSINPRAKIIGALVFIIAVVSFPSYSVSALIPYIFYPLVIMLLADIPFGMIVKRTLIALPFCLFAGISNVILNRGVAFSVGGINVSFGVLSLASILIKTPLCVSAILILVATTPLIRLTNGFRSLGIPGLFVSLFEMIYRYLGTLLEEANSMTTAYKLRSNGKSAIDIKHIGSFIGQLLIKSSDRAERVYNAMKCRVYNNKIVVNMKDRLCKRDYVFMAVVCGLAIVFRFVNLPVLLGGLV